MGIDALQLIKLALATWYISYILSHLHGPGNLFEWMREHLPHGRTKVNVPTSIDGKPYTKWEWGKNGLLDCFYCLSIWVAVILAVAGNSIALDILATAGLAGILHGYSGHRYGG